MCMSNGAQYIEEQANSVVDVQFLTVAIADDRLPVNIFQDQIRFPVGGYSCIEQFRNVRMRQLGENSSFAFEPLDSALCSNGQVQELDRNMPFEMAIAAFGQPHGPHAALA